MAFTLPAFNLQVNIYTGPWLTKLLRSSPMGNLAAGRRVLPDPGFYYTDPGQYSPAMTLLLPALTDVRDASNSTEGDIVEVPAGTGRWYTVIGVDDIGKGFANEHRFAMLAKIYDALGLAYLGSSWPVPMP